MDGRRLRRTIASSNSFCIDDLCKAVVIARKLCRRTIGDDEYTRCVAIKSGRAHRGATPRGISSRHSGSGNLVEEALTFNLLKSKRRTLERYEARTDKRR
jgi:hypothetical protein